MLGSSQSMLCVLENRISKEESFEICNSEYPILF